eukprot:1178749-Prorocentrum_minimum.AAC.3
MYRYVPYNSICALLSVLRPPRASSPTALDPERAPPTLTIYPDLPRIGSVRATRLTLSKLVGRPPPPPPQTKRTSRSKTRGALRKAASRARENSHSRGCRTSPPARRSPPVGNFPSHPADGGIRLHPASFHIGKTRLLPAGNRPPSRTLRSSSCPS